MSENKYMIQLDGLRFIAVFLVMVAHWIAVDGRQFLQDITGPAGVNLFFVLSGFLISGILMANKETINNSFILLRQFYIRRFLRIFPLYYLVILVGVVLGIGGARQYFFSAITYTINYVIAWEKGGGWNYAHLWSLAVEEQFYIVFPFLILMTKKENYLRLFYILGALAIISRIIPYLIFSDSNMSLWVSYAFTPCCFDSFAIGAILAYYFRYDQGKLRKILQHKAIFILSLIAYFICTYFRSFQLTRTLYSVFAFWVVGMAALGQFKGIAKIVIENKVVIYLGKITYGLYVYHYFMPWLFERLHIDLAYKPPVYFITTIAIASASWFFFERPINKLKTYFEYKDKESLIPTV